MQIPREKEFVAHCLYIGEFEINLTGLVLRAGEAGSLHIGFRTIEGNVHGLPGIFERALRLRHNREGQQQGYKAKHKFMLPD